MIIRANQLRVGDIFIKLGREYRVIKRDDVIVYNAVSATGVTKSGRGAYAMGVNSLEKIELSSRLIVKPRAYKGSYRWRQRAVVGDFST